MTSSFWGLIIYRRLKCLVPALIVVGSRHYVAHLTACIAEGILRGHGSPEGHCFFRSDPLLFALLGAVLCKVCPLRPCPPPEGTEEVAEQPSGTSPPLEK